MNGIVSAWEERKASVLNLIQKKPYSWPAILGMLWLITMLLIVLAEHRDLREIAILFFGFPVIYGSLVFDLKKGIFIAFLALLCWIGGTSPLTLESFEITKGPMVEIGPLLKVITYLVGCLVVAKILNAERKLIEHYRFVNNQIIRHYGTTIKALTSTIDAKDTETRGHSERVAVYALAIAQELRLDRKSQRDIFYAAVLHDIGKIGVSERLLHKDSPLSTSEYIKVKEHPIVGANIVASIEGLGDIANMVRYHHERFDGRGYPDRLAGEEIPLGARIITVVDSYDAMISRSYNRYMRNKDAITELRACSQTQFDPAIVEIFINVLEDGKWDPSFTRCLDRVLDF